jgi:hypothetical protein
MACKNPKGGIDWKLVGSALLLAYTSLYLGIDNHYPIKIERSQESKPGEVGSTAWNKKKNTLDWLRGAANQEQCHYCTKLITNQSANCIIFM